MSVIVVGIILVLGIVAMLSNYHPTQTSPIVTQLPPPPVSNTTIPPPHQSLNITEYTAYYNFLGALGLNATDIYKFNSSTLFDFGYGYNTLASTIANLLSLPADKITPWTYSEIYNVLDSNYTEWTSTKTISLYYYQMSLNGSTVYLDFTFSTNPHFVNAYQELNRRYPFPPSDNVTVNSPVYKIINETSVKTSVNVQYNEYTYLYNKYTHNQGNVTYVYEYYAMKVWGTAYLYANNQLINSQSFATTFYWYGGEYGPNYIYGTITVPPGVSKEVYGSYSISAGAGYKHYQRTVNNTTYIYYIYYPTGPYLSVTGYQFNWYKYNVTLPLKITVFNSTSPTTYVNNNTYYNRTINAVVSYTTWSSLPESYTITIKTLDYIKFLNYNLTRTWCAGSITINPIPYTQTDRNSINYYLGFSTAKNLAQPPSYIFNPIQLNQTAVLQWSYFINNYSVATGLFFAVHKDVDAFDYILPQFVSSLYIENLTEHTITLASFIEPWNVSQVTLNVSDVLAETKMIFIPVNITANTTYVMIYSALGSNYVTPNVTLLNYKWNNLTGSGFFPPLQNGLYNGTLPPAYYSPFTNKIWLNYGVYWPYGLPYAQLSDERLEKIYNYWYNPGWPGWFPIS
jgi:hypothetical protein